MTAEAERALLARLEERIDGLMESLDRTLAGQQRIEIWMRTVDILMVKMESRISIVEISTANHQSALNEFQAIKHKVQGVGALSKWMWFGIGALAGGLTVLQKAFGLFTHL